MRAIAAALAALGMTWAAGARAEEDYGLDLVGKDPYAGRPLFYSARPDDYPADCARPARATSGWHRWYRMSEALRRDFADVRLATVESLLFDFESPDEMKNMYHGRRPFITTEIVAEHAVRGRHACRVTVLKTVPGLVPIMDVPVGGDNQRRHFDNWRWIRMDVFNGTGRDVVVGFNKRDSLAQKGIGPTFVLKPGANRLACKSTEFDGYFYYRGPSGYGMSRVYLFFLAKEGDTFDVDNVRLEQELGETLSARGKLFDFGSDRNVTNDRGSQGGVFPGWTGVGADTAFTKERGFGWVDDAGDRRSHTMFHRHTHALVNDWVGMYQPGATFRVALPNGRYGVWMLGQVALMQAGISVQGKDVSDTCTRTGPADPAMVGYDVDLIRGDSGWVRYKKPRNFVEVVFDATVTDGTLDVTFDPKAGRRRGVGVYAMVVYPLDVRDATQKEIGYLMTVTMTESSEANHALIQPVYMQERSYGGMHEEFLHPERTPAMLAALAPSADETARGYVLFRRPFADPVYFDTVPARDEARAAAEPLKTSACPGTFVPLTLSVYPLTDRADATLEVTGLDGLDVDVRVERYDARWVDNTHENGTPYLVVPCYQVRRKTVALEAGLARRFCADVRVPADATPGVRRGVLRFTAGARRTDVPVEVEVLPFRTEAPDVFFAAPAPFHPLYVDYGFNTLKTDYATAVEKGLKGYLVAGPGSVAREKQFIASIDDAFRERIAAGVAGKGPRMFYTSTLTAGHQYATPNDEIVAALEKAAPQLDVLGHDDVVFWLTSFRHWRLHTRLNAETLQANADRFTWFFDAVQPSKDLAARFTAGVWLWRSGIRGRLSFADAWNAWQLGYDTHGSAYPYGCSNWVIDWEYSNAPLIRGSSFAFFLNDPEGRPCPSRDFLNLREGITDYRAIHTLETTLAEAKRAGRTGAAVSAAETFLADLRATFHADLTE
ncbi:MAG TPA: hypothetical protein VMX57_09900, partial [Planctomycetota bacterium]|nr:hypothetical protein [Planctomycetota bacterium]